MIQIGRETYLAFHVPSSCFLFVSLSLIGLISACLLGCTLPSGCSSWFFGCILSWLRGLFSLLLLGFLTKEIPIHARCGCLGNLSTTLCRSGTCLFLQLSSCCCSLLLAIVIISTLFLSLSLSTLVFTCLLSSVVRSTTRSLH